MYTRSGRQSTSSVTVLVLAVEDLAFDKIGNRVAAAETRRSRAPALHKEIGDIA